MVATSSGPLVVHLFLDDMAVRRLLGRPKLAALLLRDDAIRLGAALQLGDACLLRLESVVLAICERAIAVTALDLTCLIGLSAINAKCARSQTPSRLLNHRAW